MSAPEVGEARRLYAAHEVDAAIARMGGEISRRLGGEECLALCVLQGGIVVTGCLLPRIEGAVELDSVHVTRYRNTTQGSEVEWRARPRARVAGRRVLLVDDILDEGHSLAAVQSWLWAQGAAEVLVAVLVNKRHARKHPGVVADFVGLEVPDRYVFGYGMDYRGWHRNAPGIFALEE